MNDFLNIKMACQLNINDNIICKNEIFKIEEITKNKSYGRKKSRSIISMECVNIFNDKKHWFVEYYDEEMKIPLIEKYKCEIICCKKLSIELFDEKTNEIFEIYINNLKDEYIINKLNKLSIIEGIIVLVIKYKDLSRIVEIL